MNRVNKLKVNNFHYQLKDNDGIFLYEIDKYKLLNKGLLVIDRCLTKQQFESAIRWFNLLNNYGYNNLWITTGELEGQNIIILLTAKIISKSKYFDNEFDENILKLKKDVI